MLDITRQLKKSLQRTAVPDTVIRLIERARGIRYPGTLIGRRNFPLPRHGTGGILVFAAHQDDEVLGLGLTLARHRSHCERVTVVFTTNGAGGNWKESNALKRAVSAARFKEACDALAIIRIDAAEIVCLGFPDGGLHRYIPEASQDIATLIRAIAPDTIYVHAMEGGHVDHDVTAFIVQEACARLLIEPVFEWAEYNSEAPGGQPISDARFASDPYVPDFESAPTPFDESEFTSKQEMLAKYASQAVSIRYYPFRTEILRRARPIHLLPRLAHFTRLPQGRLRSLIGRPCPSR
ncbi:MAG TPA: PIG-L family deacetylase [Steroidobacteraceae bacterium]|nr:PIG-L family deacetylase [Steroidobacteraceae bacterium]